MLKPLHAALAGALLTPAAVHANDFDLRASPVPALLCHPSDPGALSAGQLKISGPSKVVVADCALPFNNLEISTGGDDNDMTSYRVHYRDSDGLGTNVTLTVALRVRSFETGLDPRSACPWRSNTQGSGSASLTSSTVPCAHDFGGNGFAFFQVRLETTAAGGEASFDGIVFP